MAGRREQVSALTRRSWRLTRRVIDMLNARWHLRKCNVVGRRVGLRGRAYVKNRGYIGLGDRIGLVGDTVRIELFVYPGGRIEVGDDTLMDYGVSILSTQSVTIGRHCLLAAYTRILDSDFHRLEDLSTDYSGEPVVLGDYVWLGPSVTVLKGVTIGDHAVVTANSLVTRDIPPYAIATGVPARVIRYIEGHEPQTTRANAPA
jgi:acetyltransferase-like isoleucine patch superfamily enzyme